MLLLCLPDLRLGGSLIGQVVELIVQQVHRVDVYKRQVGETLAEHVGEEVALNHVGLLLLLDFFFHQFGCLLYTSEYIDVHDNLQLIIDNE